MAYGFLSAQTCLLQTAAIATPCYAVGHAVPQIGQYRHEAAGSSKVRDGAGRSEHALLRQRYKRRRPRVHTCDW
eukprot:CAMPEP_0184393614 /NCGR_PEP_ID=MMETSP0007-20130409/35455_1 /TAXON_ID=97485 /ORGANISM="Prymnesium parvum, Strain Texoma1" /LENGTH=73 /DNA_ID=CAMNT_0026744719 /DNA_START=119 /DNA_END=337 /DNA_ORIENTATION=+